MFRSAQGCAAAHGHPVASRIAFLVAAHSEPAILVRLARALAAPWARVFIHIDAKSDIGALLHELSDIPGVMMIRDRVSVHWGGWSQVEASLRLMRTALECDPSLARFCLLSGTCYPLRSNAALRDFLLADDTEHIGIVRMPSISQEKPLTRLTRWHFEGGERTSGGKAACVRLLNRMARCAPRRDTTKALEGLVPHAGSSWWMLTREAVQIIMQTVDARPQLAGFYRHSAFPDESFFHTILANTLPPARIGSSLTFADWSAGFERPHPISQMHLARLLAPAAAHSATPFFFARKFNARNAHLLDAIDAARDSEAALLPAAAQATVAAA